MADTDGIRIPINIPIQGYREDIQKMQKMLDSLKIGSNIRRSFQAQLKSMQKDADRLQRTNARGVQNQYDIDSTKDTLLSLTQQAETLNRLVSSIDFGSLNLPQEDIQQFNRLTDAIRKARAELNNIAQINFNRLKGSKEFAESAKSILGLNDTQYQASTKGTLTDSLRQAAARDSRDATSMAEQRKKIEQLRKQANLDKPVDEATKNQASQDLANAEKEKARLDKQIQQINAKIKQAETQSAKATKQANKASTGKQKTSTTSQVSPKETLNQQITEQNAAVSEANARQVNLQASVNEWNALAKAVAGATQAQADNIKVANQAQQAQGAPTAPTQQKPKYNETLISNLNSYIGGLASNESGSASALLQLLYKSDSKSSLQGRIGNAFSQFIETKNGGGRKQYIDNWLTNAHAFEGTDKNNLLSEEFSEQQIAQIKEAYSNLLDINDKTTVSDVKNAQKQINEYLTSELFPKIIEITNGLDTKGKVVNFGEVLAQAIAAIGNITSNANTAAEAIKPPKETPVSSKKDLKSAETPSVVQSQTNPKLSAIATQLKSTKDFTDMNMSPDQIKNYVYDYIRNELNQLLGKSADTTKMSSVRNIKKIQALGADYGFDLSKINGQMTVGETRKLFNQQLTSSDSDVSKALQQDFFTNKNYLGLDSQAIQAHAKAAQDAAARLEGKKTQGQATPTVIGQHDKKVPGTAQPTTQPTTGLFSADVRHLKGEARQLQRQASEQQAIIDKNRPISQLAQMQSQLAANQQSQQRADEATRLMKIIDQSGNSTNQQNLIKQLQAQLDSFMQQRLETYKQSFSSDMKKNTGDFESKLSATSSSMNQVQQQYTQAVKTNQLTRSLNMYTERLVGSYAIINRITQAVRSAWNEIQKLDKAITGIATVTDMKSSDLWNQISNYTVIAKQYGVTTQGVYQVSQLYYQMGLSTNEVTSMTTQTLKMAKIAGLDYSTATNYMAAALNGFKMEASDANEIVDTYSALAASAATSTSQLATAMSKTASIAEASGMSLASTSAMLTMMIETTRQAPENLGTAMKSIIARFQKIDENPTSLVNIDGQTTSFNDVDTALRTVGISLTDTSGQMRDLDDVLFELSAKWDTLDRNTQKWIANEAAGSRQQSRFIALMSDNARLTQLYNTALNSEDAALVQQSKTMDSVETKITNLKNTFTQFYTSIIGGQGIKDFIDLIQQVFDNFNNGVAGFGVGVSKIINFIRTIRSAVTLLTGAISYGQPGGLGNSIGGRILNGLSYNGQSINQSNINQQTGILPIGGKQSTIVIPDEATFKQLIGGYTQKTYTEDYSLHNTYDSEDSPFNNTSQANKEKITLPYEKTSPVQQAAFNQYLQGQMGIDFQQRADMYQARANQAQNKLNELNANPQVDKNSQQYIQLNQQLKENTELANAYKNTLSQNGNSYSLIMQNEKALIQQRIQQNQQNAYTMRMAAAAAQVLGNALITLAKNAINANKSLSVTEKRQQLGATNIASGILNTGTSVAQSFATATAMGISGAAMGPMLIAAAIPGIIQGISGIVETLAPATTAELEEQASNDKTSAAEARQNYTSLDTLATKLQTLSEKQYNSADAMDEYIDAINELNEDHNELITQYDSEGNAIAYDAESLKQLIELRKKQAAEKTLESVKSSYQAGSKKVSDVLDFTNVGTGIGAGLATDIDNQALTRVVSNIVDTAVLSSNRDVTEVEQAQITAARNLQLYGITDQTFAADLQTYRQFYQNSMKQQYADIRGINVIDEAATGWSTDKTTLAKNNKTFAQNYQDFISNYNILLAQSAELKNLAQTQMSALASQAGTFDAYKQKDYYGTGWQSNTINAFIAQGKYSLSQIVNGENNTQLAADFTVFAKTFTDQLQQFVNTNLTNATQAEQKAFKSGDFSGLTGQQWQDLMNGNNQLTKYAASVYDSSIYKTNVDNLSGNLTKYGSSMTDSDISNITSTLTGAQVQYLNNAAQSAVKIFKSNDGSYSVIAGAMADNAIRLTSNLLSWVNSDDNDLGSDDKKILLSTIQNFDFSSRTGIVDSAMALYETVPQVFEAVGFAIDQQTGELTAKSDSYAAQLLASSRDSSSANRQKQLSKSLSTVQTNLDSYYTKLLTGTVEYADIQKLTQIGFRTSDFVSNGNGKFKLLLSETDRSVSDMITRIISSRVTAETQAWLNLADDASAEQYYDAHNADFFASDLYRSSGQQIDANTRFKKLTDEQKQLVISWYTQQDDWIQKANSYVTQSQTTIDTETRKLQATLAKSFSSSSFTATTGTVSWTQDLYQQFIGIMPNAADLFNFNELTNSWDLVSTNLDEFKRVYKEFLLSLGVSQQQATQQINLQDWGTISRKQLDSAARKVAAGTASKSEAQTYSKLMGTTNVSINNQGNYGYVSETASSLSNLTSLLDEVQTEIRSGTLQGQDLIDARETEKSLIESINIQRERELTNAANYVSETQVSDLISGASSGSISASTWQTWSNGIQGTLGRDFVDSFGSGFKQIGDNYIWQNTQESLYSYLQSVINQTFAYDDTTRQYYLDQLYKSITSTFASAGSIFSNGSITGVNEQVAKFIQGMTFNGGTDSNTRSYEFNKGADGLYYLNLENARSYGQSAVQYVEDIWAGLETYWTSKGEQGKAYFEQLKAKQYQSDLDAAVTYDTNDQKILTSALSKVGSDYLIDVLADIRTIFGDAADQFEVTANGFEWTSGPVSFMQEIDRILQQKYGEESEQYQRITSSSDYLTAWANARKTEANQPYTQAQLQIAANSNVTTRRTGSYYSDIISTTRDSGASIQQAGIMAVDIGQDLDNWYQTADGTYKVIQSTKSVMMQLSSATAGVNAGTLTIQQGYSQINSQIQAIITEINGIKSADDEIDVNDATRIKQLTNQLQILEAQKATLNEIANQKFEKSLNLGQSGIGSSGSPGTLLSNLGNLESSFVSFNKKGKISVSTLWNVVDNLGLFNSKLPATVKNMKGLNSSTQTYGDLLAQLKITWDKSGNAQFSLPGVDAKAITEDINDSIKALVDGQVKFWGAMVKFYEGLDALQADDNGDYNIEFNGIKYTINKDQAITWNGKDYTFESFKEALQNTTFENAEQIKAFFGVETEFIDQKDGQWYFKTKDGDIKVSEYMGYVAKKAQQTRQDYFNTTGIEMPLDVPIHYNIDQQGTAITTWGDNDWATKIQSQAQKDAKEKVAHDLIIVDIDGVQTYLYVHATAADGSTATISVPENIIEEAKAAMANATDDQFQKSGDKTIFTYGDYDFVVTADGQISSVGLSDQLKKTIQARVEEKIEQGVQPDNNGNYTVEVNGVNYSVNMKNAQAAVTGADQAQSALQKQIQSIADKASEAGANIGSLLTPLNVLTDTPWAFTNLITALSDVIDKLMKAADSAKELNTNLGNIDDKKTISVQVKNAATSVLQNIKSWLDSIKSKSVTVTTYNKTTVIKYQGSQNDTGTVDYSGIGRANGGKSQGGRTLVGQLGPQLLVRDGYYSILGQEGAEFVDLQKGDIIFDAEKTKRVLNGKTGARGIAMAQGGTYGPAASTGLQTAKQQYAYWSSLASSISGLLGGKGISSGSGSDKKYEMNLERWFNWLKKIATLENQINLLQAKRQNQTGKYVAESLLKQNELLAQQAAVYQNLATSQEAYRQQLQKDILSKYGSYFSFLEDGTMQINYAAIKSATNNNQNFATELDKVMDEYTELMDSIYQNQQAVENAIAKMTENIKTIQTAYTSMENEILAALESNYQKQINLKTQALNKKKEADNKYLASLKNSLEKQKKLREQNQDQEEIEDLERKIALLEKDTSGKNAKELASLREQLTNARQNSYYSQRSNAIDDLEESMNKEYDYYQDEIDALEQANQLKLDNMQLYWDQVAAIIETGQTNILDFLQSSSNNYLSSSALQQEIYLCTWNNTIGVALQYATAAATCYANMINTFINCAPGLCTNYLVDGTSINFNNSAGTTTSATSSGNTSDSSTASTTKVTSDLTHYTFTFNGTKYSHYASQTNAIKKINDLVQALKDKAATTYKNGGYTKSEYEARLNSYDAMGTRAKATIKKGYHSKGYLNGGLVDYTGGAWVDGTPSKPESFLDAEDTENMLEYIKIMKDMSINDIKKLSDSLSNYDADNLGTDNSTTIGDVSINIESGVVSSAAQAQNLGKTIANELMSIARQSGSVSVKRR